MRLKEFDAQGLTAMENFQDLSPANLTLRTEPDAPNVLRLVDSRTRQLIGMINSPADFSRLIGPRHVHGTNLSIKVPPQVYEQNRTLIDNIIKIKSVLERTYNRPISIDLQSSKPVSEQQDAAPHLYLDMDGVQADFFTAWARWHNRKFGQSHVKRYKDIGSKEQRQQSIWELSAEGPEFIERFFATLPTLPGGMRLVGWLKQNKIPFTVLSAPLRGMHEPSIAGKRTWLNTHNPGTSGDAIFTGTKERYAVKGGRANVLVDDHKKWVQDWQNAGGIGIVYRDDQVDRVIADLARIYRKTP